jgi:glycosyltransferase involved in cell wall biosynthesis
MTQSRHMPSENNGTQRVAMLAHTVYMFDPRVRREAEALAQQGFEVHVVGLTEEGFATQPQPKTAMVNGVHIHRLPIKKKRGNSLRYLFEYFMTGWLGFLKLAALQLRGKLKVVHVHNMPDILILSAAIPRLGGSKLVLDIHDPMPELYMSSHNRAPSKWMVKLLRLQEKVSCGLADRVISVNDSMRENLRDKGVSDDKIFIVHNFPDQRVFPIREVPASWPRNPDALSLLYCGTITQNYDLDLIVRAVARLAGEMKIRFKVVGGGASLAGIAELARSLGVADSVELIGVLPLERVHEEMRNADVGISCQRGSVFGDLQFSTKIVEYLTQGLPVVTPQTYTVTKYLPADCLFYHEPGNDAALAETLRFMWHNPEEVLRRLTRARRLLPHLSWHVERERFLAFYAELVQDPRRSRSQAKAATTN